MIVKNHQRKPRLGVLVKSLRHQHNRAHEHRLSPELRQRRALDANMPHILRIRRHRDRRNHLRQRNRNRRASGLHRHLPHLRVQIPRRAIPVLSLALVRMQLHRLPIAAMEGRVLVQHRLHVIFARRHILQAAHRIAPRTRIHHRACAGRHPSTVTPNTICVRGVSSIWLRGSSLGSVESTSNTRPSSACALTFLGNETENDCPTAASGKQSTRPTQRIS